MSSGDRLTEGHILALATLGRASVDVVPSVRVAVLSTGREIVDDLSIPLKAGQIYNATGPYLCAALRSHGAQIPAYACLPDDAQAFSSALEEALARDVQMVVSTGAVSAGTHDFIPETLKRLGAEILFHKVSIKPGKPILFARLPSGALYFGLPGNPASTAAGFRFFVHPALQVLERSKCDAGITCFLTNAYKKDKGLRHFVRAGLRVTEKGIVEATIVTGQQSFMVRPFVTSNAWAVIPESCDRLEAGDAVQVFPDAAQSIGHFFPS